MKSLMTPSSRGKNSLSTKRPQCSKQIKVSLSLSLSLSLSQMAVLLLVLMVIVILLTVSRLFMILVWRPCAIEKNFAKQGVRGPAYSFYHGNLEEIRDLENKAREKPMDSCSHDITSRVIPHYHKWFSQFGETFLYWFGTQPRVCIGEPELVKEVLSTKFGFYTKSKPRPSLTALLGQGLIFATGLDWVKHRRAVSPAFNTDKLKGMTKRMAACTLSMLDGWQEQAVQAENNCKEIDVCEEFRRLTADIIAHTAFGSSFIEGKELFEVQSELQAMAFASSSDILIPGSRYLPTRDNLKIWKLERRARNTLKSTIESRLRMKKIGGLDYGYGNDLLGLMMAISKGEASKQMTGMSLNMKEIMDEIKTFFFAGHETTSNTLTWILFLLSLNQDWQEKLREEVLSECGMEIPDADMLGRLKLVTMVILEALRLYCPVILMMRKATTDMKLGNLMIPKGTSVTIPVAAIHRNKKYWGEDANEFNPIRFAEGCSKAAKHPNALIAFSLGPRTCVGQNFAMLEMKLVVTMILQRFSFSLSPHYKHAPANKLTLRPQFGLPVLLTPLNL